MTAEIFQDDVLFYQRLLKSLGLYDDDLDGSWGDNTDKADRAFVAETARLATELGTFDSRTEGNIVTLHLDAQRAAREAMAKIRNNYPNTVKIISGTRTYAEQDRLFAKGRFGNPGPRVTNARGGQSNHNFCIAWDIAIFRGEEYLDGDKPSEVDEYRKVADLVKGDTLVWGGDWKSFVDIAHFQLNTGRDSAGTRPLFEAGKPYV